MCDKFRGRVQVCQKDVADGGVLIPAEHGVDGLGELSTRLLVDATGVDPCPAIAVLRGECACFLDLEKPSLLRGSQGATEFLKGDLLVVLPCMREDGIGRNITVVANELLELRGVVSVEQPHLTEAGGLLRSAADTVTETISSGIGVHGQTRGAGSSGSHSTPARY